MCPTIFVPSFNRISSAAAGRLIAKNSEKTGKNRMRRMTLLGTREAWPIAHPVMLAVVCSIDHVDIFVQNRSLSDRTAAPLSCVYSGRLVGAGRYPDST